MLSTSMTIAGMFTASVLATLLGDNLIKSEKALQTSASVRMPSCKEEQYQCAENKAGFSYGKDCPSTGNTWNTTQGFSAFTRKYKRKQE